MPARSAEHARRRADLVVLDVMMPGMDGLEVCRRLRLAGDVPVIMLTALGAEQDRVVGLEIGADDYVTKPFSPRELVLRVDSVLRRSAGDHGCRAAAGDRRRRPRRRPQAPHGRQGRRGARLHRRASSTCCAFLVGHPGQAFSREELLTQVWGWSFGDSVDRDRPRAPAAREGRGRPDRTRAAGDRLGHRLPLGRRVVSEQLQILAVAAGGGAVVGVLGLLAGWLLRRRSLRWQLALVAVVSVTTVIVGVVGDRAADVPLAPRPRCGHARDPRGRGDLARGRRDPVRGAGAVVAQASGRRYAASVAACPRDPRRTLPPSCASWPASWPRPVAGSRRPRRVSPGSRSPGASSSPGSPTTCAPRWPGSGRWPRRSRTTWPSTRRATTARSAARSTGWSRWSTTSSSSRASTPACCASSPRSSCSATWSARRSPGPTRSRAPAAYASRATCSPASRSPSTPPGSAGCWATSSSTASGTPRPTARSTWPHARWTAASSSRSPTAAAASTTSRASGSSTSATAGPRRAPPSRRSTTCTPRAPGSAWRSSRASSRRTTARWRWPTSSADEAGAAGCRFVVRLPA